VIKGLLRIKVIELRREESIKDYILR